MRLLLLIIILFSSRPAKLSADLTPVELDWLFKNWLSIENRRHCVGTKCIEMGFPDMVTMWELRDDTTTYQKAYENWNKRYCKAAANLVYLDLLTAFQKHYVFLNNCSKLETEEN